MYNTVIQYLYTLQSDNHDKPSYRVTKVGTLLSTTFSQNFSLTCTAPLTLNYTSRCLLDASMWYLTGSRLLRLAPSQTCSPPAFLPIFTDSNSKLSPLPHFGIPSPLNTNLLLGIFNRSFLPHAQPLNNHRRLHLQKSHTSPHFSALPPLSL